MSEFNQALDEDDLKLFCDENNFNLVVRGEKELLLDLDRPGVFPKNNDESKRLSIFKQHFNVKSIDQWDSKSGNRHVKITTSERFNDMEALLMQTFLCSDPYRSFLGFVSLLDGEGVPSVLFAPKKQLK